MRCSVSLCFQTKSAAQSIYDIIERTFKAASMCLLRPCDHTVIVSPVHFETVSQIVEKWSAENTNESCWLQYREDVQVCPKEGVAAVGVRQYANGILVYSMDGSLECKANVEEEGETITDNKLYICYEDQKGKYIIVEGTIDIDIRDKKDKFYCFMRYVTHKK